MEVPFYHPKTVSAVVLMSTCCILITVVGSSPPVSAEASAVQVGVGGAVLLPCRALSSRGNTGTPHATWSRPHDSRHVSRDGQVSRMLRDRARITGNQTLGEFHLHILYAKFPDDNGSWWCDIFNGPRMEVSLTVLVPPATPKPLVTPIIGLIFKVTSDAWTFSCMAHYSYPPVALTWSRISGPPAPFSRLPPGGMTAPDGTMSVSVDFTVTAANNDSVFVCHANHPTFNEKTFSTRVRFMLVDPSLAASTELQHSMAPPRTASFTPGDMFLVAAGFVLLLLATCTTGLLWRTSHRWELDVRDERTYMHLSTSETTATCILNTNRSSFSSEKKGGSLWPEAGRQRFIRRLSAAGILLSIVIITLTFIIPLYIRTFSIPTSGVDSVVPVMAGSLLWLDCSMVTGTGDNLLEVVWRKGLTPVYNQYPGRSGQPPFGVPANDTAEGRTLGARARTHAMGQLAVWPVLPTDRGVYICEVVRMLDDTGQTSFQRHTFAVLVMEGPQVSVALLTVAVIGLIAAVTLFGLGIYHSIRMREDSGKRVHLKNEST